MIADILPRRNYVIRRASNLSKESHIIAANIDQALLLVTLRDPETPTEFVDRFLVTCEAYKVPVTILLSKIDLQDAGPSRSSVPSTSAQVTACWRLQLPRARGSGRSVRCLPDAGRWSRATRGRKIDPHPGDRPVARHPHGRDFGEPPQGAPHDDLLDDVSALRGRCGHRHAGNQGIRADRYRRRRVVALLPRDDARGFGVPFYNCTHTHEPGCAVVEAVRSGEIALARYESYLKMLDEDDKYRK